MRPVGVAGNFGYLYIAGFDLVSAVAGACGVGWFAPVRAERFYSCFASGIKPHAGWTRVTGDYLSRLIYEDCLGSSASYINACYEFYFHVLPFQKRTGRRRWRL